MKTLIVMMMAAGLLLSSCERRSVDSQVDTDGPTGTVDEQDPAKQDRADSVATQADSTTHPH